MCGPTGRPSQQNSSTAPDKPFMCFRTSCLNSYVVASGYNCWIQWVSTMVVLGSLGVWPTAPLHWSRSLCNVIQTGQLYFQTLAITHCSSKSAIQAIMIAIVSWNEPSGPITMRYLWLSGCVRWRTIFIHLWNKHCWRILGIVVFSSFEPWNTEFGNLVTGIFVTSNHAWDESVKMDQ